MWLAGTGLRVARLASSSSHSTSSIPCATVFFVPPVSWMLNACSGGPAFAPPSFSCSIRPLIWLVSQPRPTTITDAKFACRA